MHIDKLFSPEDLQQAIQDGYVTERASAGMRIYNYTDSCTYGQAWSPVTRACRGLITLDDGTVIARPFPKFFSHNEPSAPNLPDGAWRVAIMDKMDGSLGIGFLDPESGAPRIATRGWFHSNQALEANEMLAEQYPDVRFPAGMTPLWEIIYPENRIVVDYGDDRDLVLLAVIDVESGQDLPLDSFGWPGPAAEVYDGADWSDMVAWGQQQDTQARAEGFVAVFTPPNGGPSLRFKMKLADYVRMHAAKYALTARRIWEYVAVDWLTERGFGDPSQIAQQLRLNPESVAEYLTAGGSLLDATLALLDDDTQEWAQATATRIKDSFGRGYDSYEQIMSRIGDIDEAKEFALAAQAAAQEARLSPHPLHMLRKGHLLRAYGGMWASVYPEADERPCFV